MRVKSRRFPPIEKDFAMVLAHCGSLFLDPAALQQVRALHAVLLLLCHGAGPLRLAVLGPSRAATGARCACCALSALRSALLRSLLLPRENITPRPMTPRQVCHELVLLERLHQLLTQHHRVFCAPCPLQVCHELVLLERLHQGPEFSPGASLPALTKPPLQLH